MSNEAFKKASPLISLGCVTSLDWIAKSAALKSKNPYDISIKEAQVKLIILMKLSSWMFIIIFFLISNAPEKYVENLSPWEANSPWQVV